MRNRFDLLTQQLFQKNISDCTVEELQNLADQYPYFAPAQYALLKKLQQAESPEYTKQLQKAVLFYHNPPLFEQFFNEENYEVDLVEAAVTTEQKEEPVTNTPFHPEPEPEIPIVVETDTEPVAEQLEKIDFEGQTEHTSDISEEPTAIPEQQQTQEAIPLSVQLPSLDEPAKEANNGLAFEPYHTVDYFASQGIKLSQEEATKDRFGRQLKSFTEWLKTMKKVPAGEQIKPIDAVSEQKVESLAAHSVDQAEIVTETMAEVWLKQGNKEEAIEIYNKLSLLNPSKRAYFAAKVDSLKKEI